MKNPICVVVERAWISDVFVVNVPFNVPMIQERKDA